MFSEKTRLTEKRENPFYGSYKEQTLLEEVHWQNKKKKQQLTIVSIVVIILIVLAVGITLAITLPPMLDENASNALNPPDPATYLGPSPSVLGQYTKAGVSSQSEVCSKLGSDVLQNSNGSAVDAGVVVVLCLGVVSPQSSGLGGGLFMTIYDSDGDEMLALNARETAPEKVDQELYNSDPRSSLFGGNAVGVPSELAGLFEAHSRFGRVPWADLVSKARELAETGFTVDTNLAAALSRSSRLIKEDPVLSSEFLNPITGDVWVEGDVMRRRRLASTLKVIEDSGITSFYSGELAQTIADEIAEADGVITQNDLSGYKVEWQEPFSHKFSNNLTVFGPTFPSSAPIALMALLIVDGYGRKTPKMLSAIEAASDAHHLAEALKFASTHRAQISDPNFTNLSSLLDKVLSPDYADELRSRIETYKTFDDPAHYSGVFAEATDAGTSQVSIIGPDGDAVSITSTINTAFGAGFMGNTTGLIYNNEMNDFSFDNGTDAFQLPPNSDNFAEPGKRPASSMAPLIFLNNRGQPVLATGAAGGTDILSAVISSTWRALYREMDIKTAIDHPRFTVSFNPSELVYEYGLPASIVSDLEKRGHRMRRLDLDGYVGSVGSVCRTRVNSLILANSDYRKNGGSAGF